MLALIHTGQEERDQRRLASPKLTLRQKVRLREARAHAHRPPNQTATASAPRPDRLAQALSATLPIDRSGGKLAAFMATFAAEQKAKQKKSSAVGNQGKRDRELLAARARANDIQSGSLLAAADVPLALAPPLPEANSATRSPTPARPRGGTLFRDQRGHF